MIIENIHFQLSEAQIEALFELMSETKPTVQESILYFYIARLGSGVLPFVSNALKNSKDAATRKLIVVGVFYLSYEPTRRQLKSPSHYSTTAPLMYVTLLSVHLPIRLIDSIFHYSKRMLATSRMTKKQYSVLLQR